MCSSVLFVASTRARLQPPAFVEKNRLLPCFLSSLGKLISNFAKLSLRTGSTLWKSRIKESKYYHVSSPWYCGFHVEPRAARRPQDASLGPDVTKTKNFNRSIALIGEKLLSGKVGPEPLIPNDLKLLLRVFLFNEVLVGGLMQVFDSEANQ